jgi:hypothetical protein
VGFIAALFFEERTDSFEKGRSQLAHFVVFLNDIKPIVRDGIVLLPNRMSNLPRKRYFDSSPLRILGKADRERLVEGSDFSQIRGVDNPRYKNLFVALAEGSILKTNIEEEERGSRLDPYMPYG